MLSNADKQKWVVALLKESEEVKGELITRVGIRQEEGYYYYVDEHGDISRIKNEDMPADKFKVEYVHTKATFTKEQLIEELKSELKMLSAEIKAGREVLDPEELFSLAKGIADEIYPIS